MDKKHAINKVLTDYTIENVNLKIKNETLMAENKAIQDELDLLKSKYDVTSEDLENDDKGE